MVKLLDRVKQAVSGTASSTTLGAAAEGFRTFNTAGASTNDVCRYAIEDDNGAFEIGTMVINSATTGTRTVQISSNSNNALTLTGNAVIFATLSAADLSGNAAPIWITTPPSTLDLATDGSTAVTLAGVAIDEFPVHYSWDGYSGTTVYDADTLPPQLASAPTFSGGTVSLIGSSTSSNEGSFNFRLKASDGVKTATAITAVDLAFSRPANLANTSYDNVSFSIAAQDTIPRSITFNTDGTRLFLVGDSGNTVDQFSLSTGFDLSTASYNNVNFYVGSQDLNPWGIAFNTDGTKMYISGFQNDRIFQYSTSGFDLSTASYDNVNFYVGSQDSTPRGISFNSDGTLLYLLGGSAKVFAFNLTTGFDLSTCSYSNVSFNVTSQNNSPYGLELSSDGSKMYVVGADDTAYQYSLTSDFDLSTASYDNVSFNFNSQDTGPIDIVFNSAGTKMYMVGLSNDTIYQFSV
jgi:sugar lactone lactonase YvrE